MPTVLVSGATGYVGGRLAPRLLAEGHRVRATWRAWAASTAGDPSCSPGARGLLDRLVGGAGPRRGRRDPQELRVGEALDSWRVEEVLPGALLRLRAEMTVPGSAWLELRVARREGRTVYRQRAVFSPHGLAGHAYRWSVAPFPRGRPRGDAAHHQPGRGARPDVAGGRALSEQQSLYERVGGERVFQALVDDFYAGVADDPVLRPLYEGEDLEPAKRRLRMFLEQYWGGPTAYSEERGHPRLRLRHVTWQIGERERDAWLSHMLAAVTRLDVDDRSRAAIWNHLERAAHTLLTVPR